MTGTNSYFVYRKSDGAILKKLVAAPSALPLIAPGQGYLPVPPDLNPRGRKVVEGPNGALQVVET